MCEVPQCLLKIFSALAAEPTRGMYSPSLSALCSGCQSFATVAVWPRQPAEQLVHVLQRRQVRTALGKRRGVSLARFRVVDHEEHAVRSDELQHRGRLRFTHASARRLRFTHAGRRYGFGLHRCKKTARILFTTFLVPPPNSLNRGGRGNPYSRRAGVRAALFFCVFFGFNIYFCDEVQSLTRYLLKTR